MTRMGRWSGAGRLDIILYTSCTCAGDYTIRISTKPMQVVQLQPPAGRALPPGQTKAATGYPQCPRGKLSGWISGRTAMKHFNVSFPEIAFVALTRGLAGAGIGLLASSRLN